MPIEFSWSVAFICTLNGSVALRYTRVTTVLVCASYLPPVWGVLLLRWVLCCVLWEVNSGGCQLSGLRWQLTSTPSSLQHPNKEKNTQIRKKTKNPQLVHKDPPDLSNPTNPTLAPQKREKTPK